MGHAKIACGSIAGSIAGSNAKKKRVTLKFRHEVIFHKLSMFENYKNYEKLKILKKASAL